MDLISKIATVDVEEPRGYHYGRCHGGATIKGTGQTDVATAITLLSKQEEAERAWGCRIVTEINRKKTGSDNKLK